MSDPEPSPTIADLHEQYVATVYRGIDLDPETGEQIRQAFHAGVAMFLRQLTGRISRLPSGQGAEELAKVERELIRFGLQSLRELKHRLEGREN